jgi:hypothetical protein
MTRWRRAGPGCALRGNLAFKIMVGKRHAQNGHPLEVTQKAALEFSASQVTLGYFSAFLLLRSNDYEVLEHLKSVSFNSQLGWGH